MIFDMERKPSKWTVAVFVLNVMWAGCAKSPGPQAPEAKLRVLCGSSMAAPVQELAKQFTAARRAQIEFDLGGSETLLPKILAGARADLFVCHDPFEEKLKAAGRWTRTVVVGYLAPVVAVRPGNPKNIRTLADLARPDLKIGIGDPRYSSLRRTLCQRAAGAGPLRRRDEERRPSGPQPC